MEDKVADNPFLTGSFTINLQPSLCHIYSSDSELHK